MQEAESSGASKLVHANFVFERRVPVAISKVFAAFADATARATWGAPSGTAVLIYDVVDFSEGGIERFRCGSKDNPNIVGTTQYLKIITDRLIVSSETIDLDDNRLCASLLTLELREDGAETVILLHSQMVSFVGDEMVKGNEIGNNASLDHLCRYLISHAT